MREGEAARENPRNPRNPRARQSVASATALVLDLYTTAVVREGMPKRRSPKPPAHADALTSIRLPQALLARADALLPVLNNVPSLTAIAPVTRAAVLRLAMVAGMEALETRYRKEGPR